MDFPGEKLVLRLIETLEKSGEGFFRPWQIKRIARAEAEVQREIAYSKLATEKYTEALKSLPTDSFKIAISSKFDVLDHITPALLESRISAHLADQIRKQLNVENAVEKAITSLKSDSTNPPDERIEVDWLFRWRENASCVSNEILQEIWGNVLAGEIRSPGTFSLRTLDFLKNLSQSEAKAIEAVAPYIVNDGAVIIGTGMEIGSSLPVIDFKHLPAQSHMTQLEELGLLNRGVGLGFQFNSSSELSNGHFGWFFRCNQRAVAATTLDKSKPIRLCFYKLTTLGKDVLRLVKAHPDEAHLRELAQFIANEGFDSEIMDCDQLPEGKLRLRNIQTISPSVVQ